jgi:hypothetical protein
LIVATRSSTPGLRTITQRKPNSSSLVCTLASYSPAVALTTSSVSLSTDWKSLVASAWTTMPPTPAELIW